MPYRKRFQKLLDTIRAENPDLDQFSQLVEENMSWLNEEEIQLLKGIGHALAMEETAPRGITPSKTRTVKADTALYIKLGEQGKWEQQCIEQDQTLKLAYEQIPHALCSQGRWPDVAQQAIAAYGRDRGAATRDANQIKLFYTAGEDVLWITFYKNRLWWCFSKPEVTLLDDGSKTRPVIGHWTSVDVKGHYLDVGRLSGKLLKIQGFQGTICAVKDVDYLMRKINAVEEADVRAAKSAVSSLVESVDRIIRNLHWRDFEVLIDLIFSRAGWYRVVELGGPQKTLDLVLEAPITRQRFGVQVKSQADLASYVKFLDDVRNTAGFERFYFVVHSPEKDLEQAAAEDNVEPIRPRQIAEWSVRYGLVEWIIDKAG